MKFFFQKSKKITLKNKKRLKKIKKIFFLKKSEVDSLHGRADMRADLSALRHGWPPGYGLGGRRRGGRPCHVPPCQTRRCAAWPPTAPPPSKFFILHGRNPAREIFLLIFQHFSGKTSCGKSICD